MLADSGTDFAVRDYFKEPFTVEELRALLAGLGLRPADVLSRRARAYKAFVGGREADLSDDDLLALLACEPTLLRRPLTARGDRAVIGFDRAALAALAAT